MAAGVLEKNRDLVIEYLDYPSRHYNCDRVKDTYEKKFYPESNSVQLARYAQDIVGMNSDSFILYAISMMGVADVEGIRLFLNTYSQMEKDLSIIDCSTIEPLRSRLDVLLKTGFLFRHLYKYSYSNQKGDGVATAALYTLSNSAHDFMNQRLKRRVLCNNWISTKPISELVGIASCSYVSGMIADKCDNLLEQKQGVIKTKALGTYIIPSVLKVGDEKQSMYIGFVPAFLKKDKAIMTDNDYKDNCLRFVNIIKQYFYSYDSKGKDSAVVVVVENREDLASAATWIARTGALKDDYQRIFFTGEGEFIAPASDKMPCRFLMMEEADTDAGFTLVPSNLPGVVR